MQKYSRVPIFHSMAYHSLSFSKQDPNSCAKQFAEYIRKASKIISQKNAANINMRISKVTNQRDRKQLMQACNLQLVQSSITQTIDNVDTIFPNLLKAKEIPREELELLLKDACSTK